MTPASPRATRAGALALATILGAARASHAAPPSDDYQPLLHLETEHGMIFEAPVSLASRFEDVDRLHLDAEGSSLAGPAVNDQVRVGARFDSKLALLPVLFLAEWEHDLITGHATDAPTLEGVGLPGQDGTTNALRKLWGRASLGPYLHLGGGVMTSHFGLGLVANDGAHGWTPGSARFLDPRGGDRVLRAFVATGPLTDHKLFASFAYDRVLGDDVLYDGDEAHQLVAAVILGRNEPRWLGLYGAHRTQDAPSGRRTTADVLDLAGSARFDLDTLGALTVEGEATLVTGTTALAGSTDFPVHDLRQVGVALRAAWELGPVGGVLDFLWASGDANLDDDLQTGFKADPNYTLGLLLFPHLVAAQTGRAAARADNPTIVGYPPEDVERFATRGSVSNTIAFAPRALWRPVPGLELYGGPLFAFAAAPVIDPFNTRVSGGAPRNAYDAAPGRYLGTEVDVGVRWRTLIQRTELTLGFEYGVLVPGDAFVDRTGNDLGTISGGRLLASYRL